VRSVPVHPRTKQLLDSLIRKPEKYLSVEKFVPFKGSRVAQAFQQRTFAHRILIADHSGVMRRVLDLDRCWTMTTLDLPTQVAIDLI
jgi:hypothetical protein